MQLTRILASGSLFTGAAFAAIHTVAVGDGGLVYNPNSLSAAVGDVVQFVFPSSSHTVVQADFSKPCSPLSGGFFSGTVKSQAFQINITDDKPLWFYCSIQSHCNAGMVGVINPPSSGGDIKAFADASKSVTINKPSSNGPDGGIVVAPGSSASGSASGSASASASASGSRTAVLTGSTTSGTGATGTGTVQASPTSTGAAAAVTEAAGLIIPALFAAVGLIL